MVTMHEAGSSHAQVHSMKSDVGVTTCLCKLCGFAPSIRLYLRCLTDHILWKFVHVCRLTWRIQPPHTTQLTIEPRHSAPSCPQAGQNAILIFQAPPPWIATCMSSSTMSPRYTFRIPWCHYSACFRAPERHTRALALQHASASVRVQCLTWAIAAKQGFYVLVDFHAAPGDTTVSSGNFVRDWQALWRAITRLPNFASELAGRVLLDLMNEPDGLGLQ